MLLVDAHYEPARLRGAAAAANPSLLDNLGARQQASDVAFGTVGRYPFTVLLRRIRQGDDVRRRLQQLRHPQARSPAFTDAQDLVPGYRVPTGSRRGGAAVLPGRRRLDRRAVTGNEIYSTRVVDRNGRLLPELFGTDIGGGHVLGTGNPRDGRPAIEGGDPGTTADLSLGVAIQVAKIRKNHTEALISVQPGHRSTSAASADTPRR